MQRPPGALPYVGRNHMPINKPPFLTKIFHPGESMTPPFTHSPRSQSKPNDPLFSKLQRKPKNSFFSRALGAISKILQLAAKKKHTQKKKTRRFVTQIWSNLHRKTPYFESSRKKGIFFQSHMTPLFLRNPDTECPLFSFLGKHGRYIPVNFISDCPSPRAETHLGPDGTRVTRLEQMNAQVRL